MYDYVDNERRAEWALTALQSFADQTRQLPADLDMSDPEAADEALGDLLANLMHLVGEQRFAAALERGRGHHAEEVAEREADEREAAEQEADEQADDGELPIMAQLRAVERGEAPSGSVIAKVTGPRSLATPGASVTPLTGCSCGESDVYDGWAECGRHPQSGNA